MKPILFCIAFYAGAGSLFAQMGRAIIPDSLFAGAHQVTLQDDTYFTLLSIDKSTLSRNYTVLLVNELAVPENTVALHYNDFRKIKQASVTISDLSGKKLGSYALKDFQDWKSGGMDVASENRVKLLEIPNLQLPFFVEVSYAVELRGSLFFPDWRPVSRENQSLSEATFTLRNNTSYPVRYRGSNMGEPEILKEGNATEHRWSVKGFPAIELEPLSGDSEKHFPVLYTAPTAFEMGGFEGNMGSWASFGGWIKDLNEGRSDLSAEQLAEIKNLTAALPTEREKARAVYDYVQKNMRYVSIQLGIGGWQPFPASTVHEKKYGDCKALSLYTKSLLDAVEIPSYYTLVRAGEGASDVIREDFPSAFFNHVILTLPLEGDTMWLECTSSIAPFGYLGSFTSDRHVLLIDDQGGRLVRTKAYSLEENRQETTGRIQFKEDGSASASLDRTYSGMEIEREGFFHLLQAPALDQKNWFYDHLGGKIRELTSYHLKPASDEIVPQTGFTAEVQFSQLGQSASNRLFIPVANFTAQLSIDLPDAERRAPIEVHHPYTELDSILISLPSGYVPESIPSTVELDTPFGKYRREVRQMEDGSLVLIRSLQMNKGTYPASDYAAFREFVRAVKKGDKERVVGRKGD